MPVYKEVATSQRELRVQSNYAPRLPDFSPGSVAGRDADHYDVITVGAGPSGLLATLLLSRYGISDGRLLCVDSKPGTLRGGQADGIQPRTLEVIESLGLHYEIVDQGCQFWEIAFWDPSDNNGIQRSRYAPDVDVASTYPHETTIHQGRIERIFDDDLKRYSHQGVKRSTIFKSMTFDENDASEFPVSIEVESSGYSTTGSSLELVRKTYRCKHLIGADGAHSAVRRAAGIPLVGESKEYIWGVVDFVADTDFPDVRRKSMVQSANGSCMIIPRERIATGEYLTRLYVHMDETESGVMQTGISLEDARAKSREKKSKITVEGIIDKGSQALKPYRLKMKENTVPDWWAAYEIGQRMCNEFVKKDSNGVPRIFLVGDACHTHSPKAGQGMNVSMMDSYNLAWKLAHYLLGITPEAQSLDILNSYENERRSNASELIDYDRALSTAFSKSKGRSAHSAESEKEEEELNEIWKIGHGFTSGCGIEYHQSSLVGPGISESAASDARLRGIIWPGRRLLNVRIQRHTDGRPTFIHEEFPSYGRFGILLLLATDLLDRDGASARSVAVLSSLVRKFGRELLHPVILHPLAKDIRGIDWKLLPPGIKEDAEMSFYSANPGQAPRGKEDIFWGSHRQCEDAYSIYGVAKDAGAFVILRPDQVVGVASGLADHARVEDYLGHWLKAKNQSS